MRKKVLAGALLETEYKGGHFSVWGRGTRPADSCHKTEWFASRTRAPASKRLQKGGEALLFCAVVFSGILADEEGDFCPVPLRTVP